MRFSKISALTSRSKVWLLLQFSIVHVDVEDQPHRFLSNDMSITSMTPEQCPRVLDASGLNIIL